MSGKRPRRLPRRSPRKSRGKQSKMSLAGKTLKVCSCNRTVGIDAKALAAALKSSEPLVVHEQLCRKDAAAFQAALGDSGVFVACTQEAALFGELAERADLKFVNVREQAGWGVRSTDATPKIAALVAMAALPEPEPAPAVEFKSGGELLIIGPRRRRSTGPSASPGNSMSPCWPPSAASCRSSADIRSGR